MALDEAVVQFIKVNADKGVKWIAPRLELPEWKVQNIAFKHRISLRVKGNRNGRPTIDKPKTLESQANPFKPNKSYLPIDHKVIQMMFEARGLSDKARLRTSQWKRQRKRVLDRDGHTCVYCGDVATSVDHVIPRVNGGDDTMDNLVASCTRCNSRKGSMNGHSFLARGFTPPAFVDNISPKSDKQSKSVQNGHTSVRVDKNSPFISPDQSGAN